jgi:hypothetical protein
MLHPVLTLLVASSIQLASESPLKTDLAQIAFELTQAVEAPGHLVPQADPAWSVCDIPFYFDDFRPVAAPATPILVTYDWRSPVIFDLP